MTIVAAGVHPYELPLRHAWSTASARVQTRAGILLWIRDDAGRMGLGDAAPLPGHGNGDLTRIRSAVGMLAKVAQREGSLAREPPDGVEPVPPAARHAWVQARMDLEARAADHPLAEHLASASIGDRSIPTNLVLPLAPEEETVAAARRAVAQGYRCLKLKVGPEPHEIRRVMAVRVAVGPHVALRLDANGSWGDLSARLLRAVAPLHVEYVEQPLPPGQEAAMARLRDEGVAVAADESAHHLPHALALLQRRSIDVVMVKPMALGGLDRARTLLEEARRHGVRAVVTDSAESVVGRTGALHLAALLPSPRPTCGLASGEWLDADVAAPVPRVAEGQIEVPAAAGLGLVLAEPREGA